MNQCGFLFRFFLLLYDHIYLQGNRKTSGSEKLDLSQWGFGNITAPNYNNEQNQKLGDYLRLDVIKTIINHYVDKNTRIQLYAHVEKKKKSSAKTVFNTLFDKNGDGITLIKPVVGRRGGGGGGGGRKKSKDDNNKTVC